MIKRLNVYTPKGVKPSGGFMKKLRSSLPKDITVCDVDGESPAICEVGFDLNPHAKIEIHRQLVKDLEGGGFWLGVLEFFGLGRR